MTSPGETLQRLAVPRLCGTAGADRVTADVRHTLEALGYDLQVQRFSFSGWPVRHGVRTLGVLLGGTLAAAAWLVNTGRAGQASILLLGALLLAGIAASGVGASIERLRWLRLTGENLWAMPKGRARFLVVAHRDSKSQTIPLGLRIAAAIALVVSCVVLLAVAAGVLAPARLAAWVAGGLGIAGGIVLAFCGVGNDSEGALDNASGLATLLHIAERERASGDTAFLVTDAEEFGLAGSHAAIDLLNTKLAETEAVINFDGVDDSGGFFILQGRLPRRTNSGLAGAVAAAAREQGSRVRYRPVPPGLMLDHVPFLNAGIPALTLMHGGLMSLARVHRPSDNLKRLSGAGIDITVAVACAALERLRGAPPSSRTSHP